jgi:gas vesicle protein
MTEEFEVEEEGFEVSSFLIGIGLGALVGAGVAMLLAPRRGEETRESLRAAAGRLKDRAEELLDEVKARTREFAQTRKEILSEAIRAGREAAAERRHKIEKSEGGS